MQGIKDTSIYVPKNKYKRKINLIKHQYTKFLSLNKNVKIFVSKLKRTHQSARYFGFKKFLYSKKLNEINIGTAEGIQKKIFYKNLFIDKTIKVKGYKKIEKKLSFEKRIISFLKEFKKNDVAFCFCHGFWLRYLICIIRKQKKNNLKKLNIKNADIYLYNSARKNKILKIS